MRFLIMVLFLFGVLFGGCETYDDLEPLALQSTLDEKLSRSQIPAPAPESDPGEPQKGFEQEVQEAQNV